MPVSRARASSFPNRAAAEIDFYAGFRPTFDPLTLDFGGWYYWYPGGQCYNGSVNPVFGTDCLTNGYLPAPNFNVIKKDLSFWEVYAKGTVIVNDQFSWGGAVFYSPSVLNSGAGAPTRLSTPRSPRRATRCVRLRAVSIRRSRPLVPGYVRQLLLHASRRRGLHRAVPERHSLRELHHLEPRLSASPRVCSRLTSATTIPT